MCNYCNLKPNEREILDSSVYMSLEIVHRKYEEDEYWSLLAVESDDIERQIFYCPICGRKLDKEDKENK